MSENELENAIRGMDARGAVALGNSEVSVPASVEGLLGYRFVRRAFDIALSMCVAIVGLMPVTLLCLVIRLESPGFPIPIYLQERVGHCGNPLCILKLCTMVEEANAA